MDNQVINTLRVLSAEGIEKANSGHPGLPLGAAPMAYTLWGKQMKHNPMNPQWENRDRFILSAGHGSMLLYTLLHLFDYGLTMEELKNFRQIDSKTPGHPEYGHTKGVEMTTGPLGQGLASSVGIAMAETYMANKFNKEEFKLVDHHTFALCGDGCLMEGVSSEAASLAGTLGLGKLIVLYDSNNITIEGNTDIAFREDVAARYIAYNWQVIKVEDGNDTQAIERAILEAKADTKRPSIIIITTTIGYGCEAKAGTSSAHGEPLGSENLKCTKEFLGWKEEPFTIPSPVKNRMDEIIKGLKEENDKWDLMCLAYADKYPEDMKTYRQWKQNDFVSDKMLDSVLHQRPEEAEATRISSYKILNALSDVVANLIGGSADLSPSTKSLMEKRGHYGPEDHSGSNLHFGVREHAMTAIANGISLYGGLIPYVAGFFVFSDYMKPAMRMASIMNLPVIYIMTHDSIGVGEDGPTHQPIEHLAALRALPNFNVIRPADYNETAAAWRYALQNKSTPSAFVLSRQNLKQFDNTGVGLEKGAYIIKDTMGTPDVILVASGSELSLISEVAELLSHQKINARVVSMPCWELYEAQNHAYKETVLPKAVAKVSVEAGATIGWHKYVDLAIGIDEFGMSGPAPQIFEKMGLTPESITKKIIAFLK